MNLLRNKKQARLIIVGGNILGEDEPVSSIIKLSEKYNIKLTIITDTLHLLRKCKSYPSFRIFLKKKNQQCIVSKDINEEFKKMKKNSYFNKNNFFLSIGSIWKFKEEIINFFEGNVYNLHVGKLPMQKGVGGASWQIMSQTNNSSVTIHKITKKYDEGDIICEKNFTLKRDYSLLEYYNKASQVEIEVLKFFMESIKRGKKFMAKKQNDKKSVYMPRLNTKINGFIDWSWAALDICNFIKAFDTPHLGASTFIKSKRFFLKSVKLIKSKIKFHPYQSGIIYKKTNNSILIAAVGGSLLIKKVFYNNKIVNFKKIKLGSRFFTPSNILDRSRILTSSHTGRGIKIIK